MIINTMLFALWVIGVCQLFLLAYYLGGEIDESYLAIRLVSISTVWGAIIFYCYVCWLVVLRHPFDSQFLTLFLNPIMALSSVGLSVIPVLNRVQFSAPFAVFMSGVVIFLSYLHF